MNKMHNILSAKWITNQYKFNFINPNIYKIINIPRF